MHGLVSHCYCIEQTAALFNSISKAKSANPKACIKLGNKKIGTEIVRCFFLINKKALAKKS
jgi:hypothetical protein